MLGPLYISNFLLSVETVRGNFSSSKALIKQGWELMRVCMRVFKTLMPRSNETEQDKTGWESLDITAAKTLIKIWTTNGSCNFHPRLTFAIYFIVCNCFFWVKKGLIIIVFPRITFVSGRSLNQLQSVFTTDIKAQETRLWKCGRITDNTATALTSSEPPYQNSTLVETLYKKLGNVFIFIKREINQK